MFRICSRTLNVAHSDLHSPSGPLTLPRTLSSPTKLWPRMQIHCHLGFRWAESPQWQSVRRRRVQFLISNLPRNPPPSNPRSPRRGHLLQNPPNLRNHPLSHLHWSLRDRKNLPQGRLIQGHLQGHPQGHHLLRNHRDPVVQIRNLKPERSHPRDTLAEPPIVQSDPPKGRPHPKYLGGPHPSRALETEIQNKARLPRRRAHLPKGQKGTAASHLPKAQSVKLRVAPHPKPPSARAQAGEAPREASRALSRSSLQVGESPLQRKIKMGRSVSLQDPATSRALLDLSKVDRKWQNPSRIQRDRVRKWIRSGQIQMLPSQRMM